MFFNKKTVKSDIVYGSYEDLQRERKRIIFRMIAIVLAAGAVIAALCIAWFVSNNRVGAGTGEISADMKNIELRTKGGTGIHDDLLESLMEKESSSYIENIINAVLDTSLDNYSVNWLLSDDSNMGNYSKDNTDWKEHWQNSNNKREDQAIEPGSSGKLEFFVVPKKDGTINLNMKLNLIPYSYKNSTLTESDNTAKDFIYGHILFFLEQGEDENKTLQWLQDGNFKIVIQNAKADKEYPYTLYWCWPQSFAETILKENDSFLNNNEPILSDYKNGEDIRKKITYEDEIYSMVKMPNYYFYSNLTQGPLSVEQKELKQIQNIYEADSTINMEEELKNAFIDLSSYYSQADQYIGGHVDCLRVKLEMQPIIQDEN